MEEKIKDLLFKSLTEEQKDILLFCFNDRRNPIKYLPDGSKYRDFVDTEITLIPGVMGIS